MHKMPYTAILTSGLLAIVFTAFMAVVPAHANDGGTTSANGGERQVAPIGESMVKTDVKPGLAGSFLAGRFARGHEDLGEAAQYLGETLERDPNNQVLMHETMRINLLAGNTAKAIELANKMADEADVDPLIATILMLEQVQKGDYKKAETYIVKTADQGLYGVIKPVLREWLRIGAGERVGQADLQAAIDKSGFFAPFITYHQALMNDLLGSDQLARESYLKASADPAITPYRVVEALSNYYQRPGQWKDAQAVFVFGSGQQVAELVAALRAAGSAAQIITLSNNASGGFVKQLGANSRGVVVTQVFPNERTLSVKMVQEAAELAKGAKLELSPALLEGYAAAKVLVESLRRMPPRAKGEAVAATRAKVLASVGSLKNFDLGGLEVSFSETDHTGLDFTDLSIIDAQGRFRR